MGIEILIGFFVFGFICMANGCLIFFLWWIIGQPQPVDHTTAQFTEGRIFSSFGRWLCDWYMRSGQKEEERIMDMVADKEPKTETDAQIIYYEISRKNRRPNPAKALGVCPVCAGTYLTLIINTTLIIVFGVVYSLKWAGILAIPVIVYGWALSLTALKKIFLTE